MLQLWDTAGSEQFRSVTRNYFRDAYAAIVVFDVTNRESLRNCKTWIEDLKAQAPENCLMCLTGNKIDLEDKREVSAEDMVLFAQENDLSMVFETSAKTNYGMEDMIYEIAVEIDALQSKFGESQ